MDFLTQQQAVLRQRKLADLLRLQSEQQAPYEELPGRMISGHYVAPSWSQGLSNLVGPMLQRSRAAGAENQAVQQEQAYGTAVDQARRNWQSALPRTIAGHPELQGPQAEGGSPELAAVPNQLPDRATVLRHTMAGMEIPGNEKSSVLWNQGMGQEIDREDKQQEFAAMQGERLQQQRMLQMERLQAQESQLRERLAQNERQSIRDDETRRAHQQVLLQMAQLRADAQREAAQARAESKAASAKVDKVEQRAIMDDVEQFSKRAAPLATTLNAGKEVQNLLDAYRNPDGSYRPIPGVGRETALPGWARSVGQQVGVFSPATNPNAAVVQRLLGDIMRQQAGLSQTISEQARVIMTNLASGSYTQKEFIDNWGALQNAINNDLQNLKTAPRPEALRIYEERGGKLEPIQSKFGANPTAAQQEETRQVTSKSAKQARLEELRRKAQGQ